MAEEVTTLLAACREAAAMMEQRMDEVEDQSIAASKHVDESLGKLRDCADRVEKRLIDQLRYCDTKLKKPLSQRESTAIYHRSLMTRPFSRPQKLTAQSLHTLFALKTIKIPLGSYLNTKNISLKLPLSLNASIEASIHPSAHVTFGFPPVLRPSHSYLHPLKKMPLSSIQVPGLEGVNDVYEMAVHPTTGNIYVTLSSSGIVLVLNPNLEYVKHHQSSDFHSGSLQDPRGLDISLNGTVAVVSNGDSCIKLFTTDLEYIKPFGRQNPEMKSSFYYPQDVSFDTLGNLFISDGANRQLQQYTESGEFVRIFGKEKELDVKVGWAWGLTVDDHDRLIIAGEEEGNLLAFNNKGEFLHKIPAQKISGGEHLNRGPDGGFIFGNRSVNQLQFFSETGDLVHNIPIENLGCFCFGLDGTLYTIQSEPYQIVTY